MCNSLNSPLVATASKLQQVLGRARIVYSQEGFGGVCDRALETLRRRWARSTAAARTFRTHGGPAVTRRALLVAGEPDTAGYIYRVERLAQALNALGYECQLCSQWNLATDIESLSGLEVLWVWRCPYSPQLDDLIQKAKTIGVVVLYDCDDLMFEPELASVEFIDAIRSGKYEASAVADHYINIRRAMLLADGLTASTRPLAAAMRAHFRRVFVLPNTFDLATHQRSVVACLGRSKDNDSETVRIGYASGSFTHQRDFAQAVEGIAACLKRNPQTRLILFRGSGGHLLDIEEFPALRGLFDRIEWRPHVSMEDLPLEIARFDVNLAPLEHGNRYVEAKSELKYFDAALAKVPTVASPTQPYTAAIIDGVNGMLARTPQEWEGCLHKLVSNPELRRQLGDAAYHHAIAKHGHLTKIRSAQGCLAMMSEDRHRVASAFQETIALQRMSWAMPPCADAELVYEHSIPTAPRAAVVMPLYNYASVVAEALDSVAAQSLEELELIVVDDASTDASLKVALDWASAKRNRFCRIAVYTNRLNSGLGMTRNRAVASASALYTLPLDADNKLGRQCCAELLKALENSSAALAYPFIQHFGDSVSQMGYHDWHPMLFACHNYVDAMVMLNKSAWSDVGGYEAQRSGWEDYDFCCKLSEAGYWGLRVPSAKAFYRVHQNSMVRAFTEQNDARRVIADTFRKKHTWLDISGY